MFKYGCSCAQRCPHHPHWDLGLLKRLAMHVESSDIGLTKALHPTSKRRDITLPQAEVYIRETVRQLGNADFVESIVMGGAWFDVYALYRDGMGWYIKLNHGDDGVAVISHHEPDAPITTIAHVTIFESEPGATSVTE